MEVLVDVGEVISITRDAYVPKGTDYTGQEFRFVREIDGSEYVAPAQYQECLGSIEEDEEG
jgi:hypothetical protein